MNQRDGTGEFAEIGEALEDTVRREVMEETGVRVKNIQYYKSLPWAFSNTLLIGFFCELDGPPAITMDPSELSIAKWVAREHILAKPDEISLTNEMMLIFKNGGSPQRGGAYYGYHGKERKRT